MAELELINSLFPNLTAKQKKQFEMLSSLYAEWNAQINVISRKDMENFNERHLLHSLSLALFYPFEDGSDTLDVGTGGGFPGIPLAILYPNCNFHLVDSIGKKIKVVNEVCKALKLENVRTTHSRAEEVPGEYNYVVSRAVTNVEKFVPWVRGKFKKSKAKQSFKNGILYLKGGDLSDEIEKIKSNYQIKDLRTKLSGEFFSSKKILYIPMK